MKKNKKIIMPITLPDYQRAFQVMHGLLLSEDSTPHKACLFFANAGAAILRKHFKLEAVPVAGAAFFFLHEKSKSALSYAAIDQDNVSSHNHAFHAWIQCGEWIIDFMAPLFPDALIDSGLTERIPRLMFQKELTSMSSSVEDLSKAGDYFLIPNPMLTGELQKCLSEKAANADLEKIASKWFKRTPRNILKEIPIYNEKGKLTHAKLSDISLFGAW